MDESRVDGTMYADMEKEGLDPAGEAEDMAERVYRMRAEGNERKLGEQWPAYCPSGDPSIWRRIQDGWSAS